MMDLVVVPAIVIILSVYLTRVIADRFFPAAPPLDADAEIFSRVDALRDRPKAERERFVERIKIRLGL
jgi:hypothetical protein